jgi:hypothetical protein
MTQKGDPAGYRRGELGDQILPPLAMRPDPDQAVVQQRLDRPDGVLVAEKVGLSGYGMGARQVPGRESRDVQVFPDRAVSLSWQVCHRDRWWLTFQVHQKMLSMIKRYNIIIGYTTI